MNKQRRKEIAALIGKVEALEHLITELLGNVEECHEQAETLASEETEFKENMPESLQNGEKGELADQAISELEAVRDSLEELKDALGNVDLNDLTDKLNTASE